jgi:hypothetical protein
MKLREYVDEGKQLYMKMKADEEERENKLKHARREARKKTISFVPSVLYPYIDWEGNWDINILVRIPGMYPIFVYVDKETQQVTEYRVNGKAYKPYQLSLVLYLAQDEDDINWLFDWRLE